jgi:hypothetical protein
VFQALGASKGPRRAARLNRAAHDRATAGERNGYTNIVFNIVAPFCNLGCVTDSNVITMAATTRIVRIANSRGIRIPKTPLE